MADAQYDTASASKLVTIVPSDATQLELRGVYVGGAGDVAVMGFSDTAAVVFKAVPVGTILPVVTRRVMATGTTATLLVGLV